MRRDVATPCHFHLRPASRLATLTLGSCLVAYACGRAESDGAPCFAGAAGVHGSQPGTGSGGEVEQDAAAGACAERAGASSVGAGGTAAQAGEGATDGDAGVVHGGAGSLGDGGGNTGPGGEGGATSVTAPKVTQIIELVSDGSWRTYGAANGVAPPPGWQTVGFDDSSWTPSVAPNPAACGSYEPAHVWERPNQPMWDSGNEFAAFFRKVFALPAGATVGYAKITAFADDDIAIWVNGVEVFIEDAFGAPAGVIEPHELDLAAFLRAGDNLIAIQAQDSVGGGCRWAIVSGSIEETHAAPPRDTGNVTR